MESSSTRFVCPTLLGCLYCFFFVLFLLRLMGYALCLHYKQFSALWWAPRFLIDCGPTSKPPQNLAPPHWRGSGVVCTVEAALRYPQRRFKNWYIIHWSASEIYSVHLFYVWQSLHDFSPLFYRTPEAAILTSLFGVPDWLPSFSIKVTIFIPSTTSPKAEDVQCHIQ